MDVPDAKRGETRTATSTELMNKAEDVYDRRSNRVGRELSPFGDVIIGEIPVNPGDLLRVVRHGGGRRPRIEFRLFAVTPGGDCRPLRGLGFTLSANVLPQFAGLVAAALDVELKEIPVSLAPPQPASSAGDVPSVETPAVTGGRADG